ncbi:MAG: hypothetical protein EBT03_08080 [Betaproteobacteria bacterium]|nr:hypothetical protein [Betaproteobacteria bacterium]NCA16915.1 hypothetical protein [Betaproteobacteria bacterium]
MPQVRSLIDSMRYEGLLDIGDIEASRRKARSVLCDGMYPYTEPRYVCGVYRSNTYYRLYVGRQLDYPVIVAEDAAGWVYGYIMHPGAMVYNCNSPDKLNAIWLYAMFTRACLRNRLHDIADKASEHHREIADIASAIAPHVTQENRSADNASTITEDF